MVKLSCGVLVIDKHRRMLMFNVNASTKTFWDIPKGTQEEGESPLETALRELKEETSLVAKSSDLIELGWYQYNRYKDLYLYLWVVDDLDVSQLKVDETVLKRENVRIQEV